MKKILMTVALAALSIPAVAEDNFSGGYVGVQAGTGFSSTLKGKDGKGTVGGNTMVANLVGGTGSVFSENLYAGAEGQVGTGFGSNRKSESNGVKFHIQPRGFFTVGGRLGYLPTQEIMLFASLAAGYEKVNFKGTDAKTGVSPTSSNGFMMLPGIGAEFKVAQNLNVRADLSYKYAWHKHSTKVRQPIAKLGVVYKF